MALLAFGAGWLAWVHPAPLWTQPCGKLSVGAGWQVAATPNVSCSSARELIATFFRQHEGQDEVVVNRYHCAGRELPDAEHIRCSRPSHLVTAKSLGY